MRHIAPVILIFVAFLTVLFGFYALVVGKSTFHEQTAFLSFLIAVVAFGLNGVMAAVDASREQTLRLTEIVAHIEKEREKREAA